MWLTAVRAGTRSVVLSELDYRSVVYGATRKSHLSKLEPVASAALRLRLSVGTFHTSLYPAYGHYLENLHLVSYVISSYYKIIIN